MQLVAISNLSSFVAFFFFFAKCAFPKFQSLQKNVFFPVRAVKLFLMAEVANIWDNFNSKNYNAKNLFSMVYFLPTYQFKALGKTFLLHIVSNLEIFPPLLRLQGTSVYYCYNSNKVPKLATISITIIKCL